MAMKNTKDHWAFLEEIEAPMWVDLIAEEANSYSQHTDDEWFNTTHPFHQYSARQLKAAFSRHGEGSVGLDFDILGPSSPKLPASVSRSRGKDYKSKKWGGENCDVSKSKPHPVKVLSGKSLLVAEKMKPRSSFMKPKSSCVDTASGKEIKPKLSFIRSTATSSSKRSLVCERSSTANSKGNSSKSVNSGGGFKSNSSSMVDKAYGSNTGSLITSESGLEQQKKVIEVSSQALGHNSGLLSAATISLRKSFVARQAFRMESNNGMKQSPIDINNDRKEARNRNSSGSKSSVGSSSIPNSKNVARMTEPATNRVEISNVSKLSTVQVNEGTLNSRRADITGVAKLTHKETAKSKVKGQTLRAKSSLPVRVNRHNLSTGAKKDGEKMGFGRLGRVAAGGQENAMEKIPAIQKCSSRENVGGNVRGQNKKKENVPQTRDTRGLAGSKDKISGGKNLMHVNQRRVYLR